VSRLDRRPRPAASGRARRIIAGVRVVPGASSRSCPRRIRRSFASAGRPGRTREASRCWGTAYQVTAAEAESILAGLDHRERGGYRRLELEITLDDPLAGGAGPSAVVPGLVYVAGPGNDEYLGPAPLDEIARQVARAEGPSGANAEYLFELAAALRRMQVADDHVFALESAVRAVLARPDEPA
jgi:cation transport regulator ChaC